MNILGLNIGHDAAAALIIDGKVIAAIGEERITRVKNHIGFPYNAIDLCLKMGGISPAQLDAVAAANTTFLSDYASYLLESFVQTETAGRVDFYNEIPPEWRWKIVKELIRQRLMGSKKYDLWKKKHNQTLLDSAFQEAGIPASVPVRYYDHHLAHAASVQFTAGVEDTLIVTLDGEGDGLYGSVSVCNDIDITVLDRLKVGGHNGIEISPGEFYANITRAYSFRRLRHEGKITGLAAFGRPEKYFRKLQSYMDVSSGKEFFKTRRRKPGHILSKIQQYHQLLKNGVTYDYFTISKLAKMTDTVKFPPDADLAAAAQLLLEETVTAFIEHWVNKTGKSNVLLAGGIFANVKLNQRISEIPGVSHIFIHPNMGDGGLSVGAGFLETLGQPILKSTRETLLTPANDVYWGPEYSDSRIKQDIESAGYEPVLSKKIEDDIADALVAGKIVGRFYGRMEYGPRALGHRSILASPTDASINTWLNKRLHRTEFMPFAPSVCADSAGEIFQGWPGSERAARFMTITYNMEENWKQKAPAICHIDGTARPQVVFRDETPDYARVLEAYKKKSGLPLLINTSFNNHEEPIVCTPADALKSFRADAVDCLAIGNYFISQSGRQSR